MSTPRPSTRRFDAVVIGASAGGVEALGRLLAALPANCRAAVLVVLHLPPERPSHLAEVLAARCNLPVREALDKAPAEPGLVQIAPPDYHLLVEPGRTLALSMDAPVLYSRPAIDVLFESAALAYRRSLLGIVLTGASSDGAAGLVAVRRLGGQGWVQDPQDAAVPVMPAAAIELAGADLVLPLDGLAAQLSLCCTPC